MGDDDGQAVFWREFMKTDEAQDALKMQYREEYDELADEYESKVKPQELRELAEALLDCSREIKHIVAPLLKYDFCQRILYNILQDCTRGTNEDGSFREKRNFSEHLMTHHVRYQMEKLAEEVRANPTYGKAVNDQWWAGICSKMAEDNKRDMFDHPRYIDVHGLCSMMNQGGLCLDMGKTKWKERNYELALDRYTMGVDMLQNLRCRGAENEELLSGVTCRLLRNQAACALKLELWGLCTRACDKVLHFKPRDFKALYRKGVAATKTGDFDGAESCFKKVTELVPDSYEEAYVYAQAKKDAAKQLAGIARRKAASNAFGRTMVKRGFLEREGLFSDDRHKDEADRHTPMDEGLRHHIAERLREQKKYDDERRAAAVDLPDPCVDDDLPTLDLDRCIALQEDVKALYRTPAFMKALGDLQEKCGSSSNRFLDELETFADDQKADVLEKYGFTGWAGARAAERAIANKLDDPVVRANAKELFEMVTEGYDFKGPPPSSRG